MPIVGNGRLELAKLIRVFQHAGDGKLFDQLKKSLAGEAHKLLIQGFRKGQDPYGNPWAPLKHRKGVTLVDTARMRNSFTYRITAGGFEIGSNVTYTPHHQYGTAGRKKDRRRMQAVGKRGRFISRAKAGKAKRGSTSVRLLEYKAGTGGIPKRQMVPEGDLGPIWAEAFNRVAAGQLRKFMSSGAPKPTRSTPPKATS